MQDSHNKLNDHNWQLLLLLRRDIGNVIGDLIGCLVPVAGIGRVENQVPK